MTRRTDQVASTILRAVQEQLARGLHDPRVGGLITVTGVEVSPDLRSATVLVTVWPEDRESLTVHGLDAAAGHLRRAISDHVRLRRTPDLRFRIDDRAKRQAGVLRAIAQANQPSGRPTGPEGGSLPRAGQTMAPDPAVDRAGPGGPPA